MNEIDDGGPAFPTDDEHQIGTNAIHNEGMSLRHYFAAKAMAALIAKDGFINDDGAAQAFASADRMIKAGKS